MEVVILIRWSVHLHLCVVNVSVHVFVHKNEEAQKNGILNHNFNLYFIQILIKVNH